MNERAISVRTQHELELLESVNLKTELLMKTRAAFVFEFQKNRAVKKLAELRERDAQFGRDLIAGDLAAITAAVDKEMISTRTWRDNNCSTCLLVAALHGHADIVRFLLKRHVDVNGSIGHVDGWTPLIAAADRGHVEVSQLLLAAGAATARVDIRGLTALQHARSKGHSAVVEAMEQHIRRSRQRSEEEVAREEALLAAQRRAAAKAARAAAALERAEAEHTRANRLEREVEELTKRLSAASRPPSPPASASPVSTASPSAALSVSTSSVQPTAAYSVAVKQPLQPASNAAVASSPSQQQPPLQAAAASTATAAHPGKPSTPVSVPAPVQPSLQRQHVLATPVQLPAVMHVPAAPLQVSDAPVHLPAAYSQVPAAPSPPASAPAPASAPVQTQEASATITASPHAVAPSRPSDAEMAHLARPVAAAFVERTQTDAWARDTSDYIHPWPAQPHVQQHIAAMNALESSRRNRQFDLIDYVYDGYDKPTDWL